MSHISSHIHLYVTEEGQQKQIEQQGCVRNYTLCHVKVGKGGIADKIHVGKHTHQCGDDTKPKHVVREKFAQAAVLLTHKAEDKRRPHNHVTGVDRQYEVGIVAQIRHGAAVKKMVI